ncbi:YqgE/AlgH family protein [Bacteroidia bacterium]|jgi:putative transcriptional regulator|nr:YqgE/AlgH family protein [Bacteroidia bacterium]
MNGRVLISEPFLPDPNFNRSVILITEHDEKGSMGYVLNQRTDYTVNTLVESLDKVNNTTYQGGPVELNSLHYLHTYPQIEGSIKVQDGVYWGGDFGEACDGLMSGSMQQENFRFFVGYSGWAAGQLQAELDEKAWMVGDLEAKYIFDQNIEDDALWKHAIREQGGTNALLANAPTDPFLN